MYSLDDMFTFSAFAVNVNFVVLIPCSLPGGDYESVIEEI